MAITNKYNYVYEANPEYSDVYVNSYLNALASYGYDQAALDKIAESTFGKPKETTPAAVTTPAVVTPSSTTQTFSDQIINGPDTSQDEFMSLVSTPASTVVGGTGNDTVVGGTGNATVVGAAGNDTVVAAAGADTVTGAKGNDTVANWPTIIPGSTDEDGRPLTITTTSDGTPFYLRDEDGGGMYQNPNTVESYAPITGADGKTYYAVYAPVFSSGKAWNETPITGYMTEDQFKKFQGGSTLGDAVQSVINSPVGSFALGVLGPYGQAINAVNQANQGNLLGAAVSGLGAASGFGVTNLGGFDIKTVQNVARGLNAIDKKDLMGALTAGSNVFGGIPGDYTTVTNLASAALALNNNDTAGFLSAVGDLTGSSDAKTAAAASRLLAAVSADNPNLATIQSAASGLNSAVSGTATTGTTGTAATTGSTTVGNFEDTEVTRLKGLGYTNAQIQEYFRNLDNLTEVLDTPASTVVGGAGNDVTLPGGVQLASVGDGVFKTEVGGVPTYAESTNASSVTAPLGYTLLSTSEVENKPEGAYYDITANAWFKPDTAVTDLTGDATIKADADLFNSSLGTLDQLDANLTSDDFEDFLRTIGITNTTQLADSGLSNQDILDMINALDDTVVVTGGTGNDVITGVSTIGGAGDNDLIVDDKGEVIIKDKKESCPVGTVLNPETGDCDVVEDKGEVIIKDKKESCPIGTVLNTETGECEVVTEQPITCPPGKVLNEAGTACIDEVIIKGTRDPCPTGTIYDEDLDQCVPIKEDQCPTGYHRNESGVCVQDDCPEGFERDEITGQCIPVVTIVDKKCPPGQVYDEELKFCVPIEDDSCPTGFHKDGVTGLCVPDTKDDLKCPEGYEPNAAGTECIPVVTITDKKCDTGFVYDEDLKMCVPITVDEACPTGFHKDETGKCVPDTKDDLKCPEGYEPNEAGTACIPVVTITDKKCPPGQVYDEDLKMCVAIKEEECPTGYHRDSVTGACVPDEVKCEKGYHLEDGVCVKDKLECPEGYELNEAGTECIPIIEIVDKKCPVGQVYDEELKKCVPIKEDECPEGYERDEITGKCIPVVEIVDKKCPTGFVYDEELKKCVPIKEDECPTGYHRDQSGVCVKDTITCPKGYELNEAGTECIPIIEIVDKKCPVGQVYDEELKKCVPIKEDECPEGYVRNLATGVCEKPLVCEEGFELNDAGTECVPVIEIKACPTGQHRDETGKCVPDTEECAEGFHLEDGLCVPDDDEKCKDGYEKVDGQCVPVCKEGYIRNLETGVCEKAEKECPVGQVKDANGKCVPIKKTDECQPGYERIDGVCVPICKPGYKRVNGVCVPIAKTTSTYRPSSGSGEGEKTDPIYATGMDNFDLFATLEELLKENSDKTDTKKASTKSKDKTKMATGGHLDDLLAEQMTVDDLLKLLR